MLIDSQDRRLLRDLARQLADLAAQPVMAERRVLWERHNSLQPVRPLILVFPEGSWRELVPEETLLCLTRETRNMERSLRQRLYYANFFDDTVIESEWRVPKAIANSGWGVEPRHVDSTAPTGSWGFDPVIIEPADLNKLRLPEITLDEAESQRRLADAQELFGDILDVKLKGVTGIGFHLMYVYAQLRGLEQVMVDTVLNPGMLHDAMAFLEEGYRGVVAQYVAMNLFELNNDGTYQSSGGNGYTKELPAPGFDPKRVRPRDMWSAAETQEMAQVSPAAHREFCMEYEKRLLAPFGLSGYGCCEDLTRKLDDVFTIPNLRRISISPWADVPACAAKLRGRYIFSWKPNPAMLVGQFDPVRVRAYIADTLAAAREHGCVLEMILKDTHTCENHPERFTEWTRIARELVDESAASTTP